MSELLVRLIGSLVMIRLIGPCGPGLNSLRHEAWVANIQVVSNNEDSHREFIVVLLIMIESE